MCKIIHTYFDIEPLSKREAWEWLKYNVNKQNQLILSIRYLSYKWRWERSKVCRFLTFLKTEEFIETSISNGKTLVTISNHKDNYSNGKYNFAPLHNKNKIEATDLALSLRSGAKDSSSFESASAKAFSRTSSTASFAFVQAIPQDKNNTVPDITILSRTAGVAATSYLSSETEIASDKTEVKSMEMYNPLLEPDIALCDKNETASYLGLFSRNTGIKSLSNQNSETDSYQTHDMEFFGSSQKEKKEKNQKKGKKNYTKEKIPLKGYKKEKFLVENSNSANIAESFSDWNCSESQCGERSFSEENIPAINRSEANSVETSSTGTSVIDTSLAELNFPLPSSPKAKRRQLTPEQERRIGLIKQNLFEGYFTQASLHSFEQVPTDEDARKNNTQTSKAGSSNEAKHEVAANHEVSFTDQLILAQNIDASNVVDSSIAKPQFSQASSFELQPAELQSQPSGPDLHPSRAPNANLCEASSLQASIPPVGCSEEVTFDPTPMSESEREVEIPAEGSIPINSASAKNEFRKISEESRTFRPLEEKSAEIAAPEAKAKTSEPETVKANAEVKAKAGTITKNHLSFEEVAISDVTEFAKTLFIEQSQLAWELEKFKDYWRSVSKKAPKDGVAAFRNWVRKSIEFKQQTRGNYGNNYNQKPTNYQRFINGAAGAVDEFKRRRLEREANGQSFTYY